MTEPNRLSATEAAGAIARGELTAERLVRSCLDRIAARNPQIHAWAHVDRDLALAQARGVDRGAVKGPLAGVPVGVKDMIDTADLPTEHNSPLYVGHRPSLDAACVTVLRAAGAVIIGKTETHEFAAGGALPRTRNPHDQAHTSGGSSAGSAAAVADFMAPLTLGTQTAGSCIRPASFCGVVALKPSFGVVSREGAKFYSVSLDTIGFYARAIADLQLLADVFAIARNDTPVARKPVSALRIALCRTAQWDQADADCRAVVEHAADALRAAGAAVTPLELPKPFERLPHLQRVLMRSEGRAAFLPEHRRFGARLHDEFRAHVENRDGYTRAMIREAADTIAACRPVFDDLAGAYDAVLTPSAIGEAPRDLNTTGDPLFNRMWTALHAPVINLPSGRGARGLPIGVSLVAPRWHDAELLAVAAVLEPILVPGAE
jgi:Asp-tRNA(Asn)/Glu-tRNA(Gln) amidotransferase A subunit family amidase